MPSMLEVLREYKHLTAKKRAEGFLPPSLEERLAELEGVVKGTQKKAEASGGDDEKTPPPASIAANNIAANTRGATLPAPKKPPSQPSYPNLRPPPAATTPAPAVLRAPTAPPPPQGSPPKEPSNHRGTVAPAPAPAAAPPAPSRPSIRLEPPTAETTIGALDRLALHFPKNVWQRTALIALIAGIMLVMDFGFAIMVGLPMETATGSLAFALGLIGGTGWFIFYPALIAWREYAASKGNAHINEPDFVAKVPMVEPIILTLTVLGTVIWIWLGGHTTQGVAYLVAILFSSTIGLVILGFMTMVIFRPIARAKVKARALRQYLEGGVFHMNKGNPKRARRLLERALEEARGTPQQNEVVKHLKNATLQEADELRKKGHFAKADEMIRAQSSRPGMELLVGWASSIPDSNSGENSIAVPSDGSMDSSTASDILASPPKPPALLHGKEIIIESNGASRKPSADEAAIRERARILERRGRQREAFEILVMSRVSVTRTMAETVAKDYIAQGMLRSADVIFEALGQQQMPEFYQAVAAEWAKSGDPPADACLRLARILADLDQPEAAARVACRGALSPIGDPEAKQEASEFELDLCKRLGMEPPVELVESMGDYATAARAYDAEGRQEEALRCYRLAADAAMKTREPAAKLIPILSKIFLLDAAHEEKYLEPLAQHVIDTNASGPSSMKILAAYKARKRDDERLAARLFQLYVDAQQGEDAYRELDVLMKANTSNPEALLKEFRLFVERFPDHLKARGNYIRALLKIGRIDDAAAQVRLYIARAKTPGGDPAETIALIELLLDWGHSDKELRKSAGVLRIEIGDQEKGLEDLERYVKEGGRDPGSIQLATSLLSEDLALPTGGPNHPQLLRLGRFLLHSGDPETSIQHLEICRSSKDHKSEAEVLLARAYTATGNAKRAVAVLQKAISGRQLSETLEQHYELARALEVIGATQDAEKIDRAIKKTAPDFVAEYEKTRGRTDRSDTAWAPEGAETADPTDVGAKTDATPPPAPRATKPPSSPSPQAAARSQSQAGRPAQSGARGVSSQQSAHAQSAHAQSAQGPGQTPQPSSRSASGVRRGLPPASKSSPGSSSKSQPGSAPPISPSSPAGKDDDSKAALNLGETLLPRYRLLRKLGAGGMGEVHLAEDVDLGRYVAIKVLRRSLATDLFLQKFKEEARIVAQLAHQNIVNIYDLGQKGNYSYIVMEYVDGPDLASLVNRSGGFERKRLIKIVAMVADAMEYAHGRGVIHRDLKPANILVGPNDFTKVTDFGIAKVLQPDGQETAFSAAGLQVGTVNYMAPEQISGKPIDSRTDLYLLGTTLYVCLSGQFPYTGEAIVFQKLREDATPLRTHVPSVTSELEACVMRCLARKPEDRYQSMAEFSEAVRKVPEARSR